MMGVFIKKEYSNVVLIIAYEKLFYTVSGGCLVFL